MAFTSRFFGSAGGDPREYTQAQFAQWDRAKLDDGFVPDEGNELQVLESVPAAMSVDIETGQGFVQGFFVDNDALEEDLVIGAAHATLDRIDTIVLNLDILSTRLITPVVVQGTPAGSPVPPTLTQDTNTWQVAQADVLVVALATTIVQADITDRRTPVTGKHLHTNIANDNVLINDNFLINTLDVTGTVILLAGEYGHDGWKAGASGCTYTFSTIANLTTLTISAGSLTQVVEGNKLQSDSYTFSWDGTATGNIDGGSDLVSPITDTLTGGTNATVEINTGTLTLPKLEIGTIKTVSLLKTFQEYLTECRRYAYKIHSGDTFATFGNGQCTSTTESQFATVLPVEMMDENITLVTSGNIRVTTAAGSTAAVTLLEAPNVTRSKNYVMIKATVASGLVAGNATTLAADNDTTAFILLENRL